jgi:ribosomal protein S18 acetylase RimI-like enzyme
MASARPQLAIAFGALTDKNLEQLRVLNTAIFPVRYDAKVYAEALACGEVTQLAFHNDVVVGAVACRLEKAPGGPKLYIITLGVLAPYRGMGVGSRLLEKSLAVVAASLPEVTEAYLHVQTSNEEAAAFYARFGFEKGEVVENYYRRIDPPHAQVLRKVLAPPSAN